MMEKKGPIIKKAEENDLGWKRVKGYAVPYNEALGVNTYFSGLIQARINKEKPCNVIFTGEPGISKTYSAEALARFLQPKTFGIENVVMTYTEFMENMINLPKGRIIVYDEPEYGAGHRDWMANQNKALVATMRSGRFKVHPIFMPVINKRLLDKVIRENLIQFHVHVKERGEASAYKVNPSQWTDKTYHDYLCDLYIEMLDGDKCQEKWCYSCKEFQTCPYFRAQYERKRESIQNARYETDLSKAKNEENKDAPTDKFKRTLLYVSSNRDKYKVVKNNKETYSSALIEINLNCTTREAGRLASLINTLDDGKIKKLCETDLK